MKVLKLFILAMSCLACLFTTSQTNLCALGSSVLDHKPEIFKIESLSQIQNDESIDTVYFFDIDDTLFDSQFMLGSKAWQKYITTATKDDLTQNWHDVFSLFIARKYPLKAVEPITSQFVQHLQAKGCAVFGLTARERKIWHDTPTNHVDALTISQLESIGITLDIDTLNELYPQLTTALEYFGGVFFADIEPKGKYLLKLFKNTSQLPKKIIFIDDKQSQVESVAAALNHLGIDHACYWYTATDEKMNHFNPLIANIQLYYLWKSNSEKILSDEDALSIAKQYPERDEAYYLHALLKPS